MIRIALITLLTCALLACQRSNKEAVTIVPSPPHAHAPANPGDPFAPSSSAYSKLREVTEGALDRLFERHAAAVVRPDRYVFGVTDESTSLDDLVASLESKLVLRS